MRGVVLLLVGASCPSIAMADWFAQAEGGLLHDNNLNNAELSKDIQSDRAVTASVAVGQFVQLNQHYSLTLMLDLKAEVYDRFSGMNNISVGPTLALRRKLGIGAAAPWLRTSVSVARLEFNDDVRDGWVYRASVTGGKRLAERWELQGEYTFERRTADHATAVLPTLSGAVYDLRSHALTFDARYSATEKTLLFAGYTWRDGDVVSTSAPNAKIFRGSTALARDPTFGPSARAYRLDAVSHILSFGVSQAMTSDSAVNVSYQRQMTNGAGDNNYYKNIFAASYSHRF